MLRYGHVGGSYGDSSRASIANMHAVSRGRKGGDGVYTSAYQADRSSYTARHGAYAAMDQSHRSALRGGGGGDYSRLDTSYAGAPTAVSRVGNGAVSFGGPSASAGMMQLRQFESALQSRLHTSEQTARAVIRAQECINADAMLGRAKGQGQEWLRDKSKLASAEATVDMSPLAVRAMQAERDELRQQIRAAAAELQKIQHASGGRLSEVEASCQRDMERLARVRSQLTLEDEQNKIRITQLEEKVSELQAQRKSSELHIGTAEEQLSERSEALLKAKQRIDRLELELHQTRQAAKDNLHKALTEQAERISSSADQDKRATIERIQADNRSDLFKQLDAQREELEVAHQTQLSSKLSEQRHALLAQLQEEKARELQAMQTELYHREQANLKTVQAAADEEHAVRTKALLQKHQVIQARLEGELESLRRESGAELSRRLTQLRQELMADQQMELRRALDAKEKMLWNKHLNEMDELRDNLNRKARDSVQAAVDKATALERKNVKAACNREMRQTMAATKAEWNKKKMGDMQTMKHNLATRKDKELEMRLNKQVDGERRQAQETISRQKAKAFAEAEAQFRREKALALQGLRERMEVQHREKTDELEDKVATLTSELDRARQKAAAAAGQVVTRSAATKASYQALREELRQLQSILKQAVIPEAEGHIDTSEASPSQSLGHLASLVAALGTGDIGAQPAPSMAATGAPEVTVDVLMACSIEMANVTVAARREVEAVTAQLHRDRILIRKQVEDEVHEEHVAEVEALKVALEQDKEQEVEARILAAHQTYNAELNRERKAMESEMHTMKVKASARSKLLTGKDGKLAEELKSAQTLVEALRTENNSIKAAMQEAGGGGVVGGGDPSAMAELREQVTFQEKERLRLEKTVQALREALSRA